MAARKSRPLLYEVHRPSRRAPDADPKRRPPDVEADRGWLAPEEKRRAETSGVPNISSPFAAEPSGERWRIALSAPTLAVLLASVVVLLAVAFSAGRRYEAAYPGVAGPAEPVVADADAADSTRSGSAMETGAAPPEHVGDAKLVADETPAAPEAAARPAQGSERPQVVLQKGYHYVVVQHFRKSSGGEAALAAAKFLGENGVPCATLTGADIRLVATEPFLIRQADRATVRREQRRADQLIARIKQLGQEFNKKLLREGKQGYTFSGCRLVEFK